MMTSSENDVLQQVLSSIHALREDQLKLSIQVSKEKQPIRCFRLLHCCDSFLILFPPAEQQVEKLTLAQTKPTVAATVKPQLESKIPDSPSVSAAIPPSPSVTPVQDENLEKSTISPPASVSGKSLYSQRVILTSE
jgi:hypothetical protein